MSLATFRFDDYSPQRIAALLMQPEVDAHKYSRGKLTLVAGSSVYPGAACLAAYAGQRMGAGYTMVYCDPDSLQLIRQYRPSLVGASWENLRIDDISVSRPGRPAACVAGCGFTVKSPEQAKLALRLVRGVEAPLLVDGGALFALGSVEGRLACEERAERGLPLILTPHGGEADRLAKAARIYDAEGMALACELAKAYRCIVVLKGPTTFIADSEHVVTMSHGTAALAKAGTGDVLSGMIGALLAQGRDPFDAAVVGATVHAYAGQAAALELTSIAVTPEDVIEYIPVVLKDMLAGV